MKVKLMVQDSFENNIQDINDINKSLSCPNEHYELTLSHLKRKFCKIASFTKRKKVTRFLNAFFSQCAFGEITLLSASQTFSSLTLSRMFIYQNVPKYMLHAAIISNPLHIYCTRQRLLNAIDVTCSGQIPKMEVLDTSQLVIGFADLK